MKAIERSASDLKPRCMLLMSTWASPHPTKWLIPRRPRPVRRLRRDRRELLSLSGAELVPDLAMAARSSSSSGSMK